MGGRAAEEQTHGPFFIPGMEWYFPASTVSVWALLWDNSESKGADKYCTDICFFRKAKQKHMMSAVTFPTNTLIKVDTGSKAEVQWPAL